MKSREVSVVLDEGQETFPADNVAVVDEGPLPGGEIVVDEDQDGAGLLPDGAVLNEDGTVTLTLKHPRTLKVRSGGQVRDKDYGTLTFHRMTGADMRAVSAASKDSSVIVAFARSTRIQQVVMNALFDIMDGADIQAAGEVIEYFFGNGRKTGR